MSKRRAEATAYQVTLEVEWMDGVTTRAGDLRIRIDGAASPEGACVRAAQMLPPHMRALDARAEVVAASKEDAS